MQPDGERRSDPKTREHPGRNGESRSYGHESEVHRVPRHCERSARHERRRRSERTDSDGGPTEQALPSDIQDCPHHDEEHADDDLERARS